MGGEFIFPLFIERGAGGDFQSALRSLSFALYPLLSALCGGLRSAVCGRSYILTFPYLNNKYGYV
jgi:hypothetical protein